jgi:hypothetical protein
MCALPGLAPDRGGLRRDRQRAISGSSAGGDPRRRDAEGGARQMSELLGLADVARIVGVSYERARQLRHQPGFLEPVGRRGKGDLWAASEIQQWARTYDDGDRRWGRR